VSRNLLVFGVAAIFLLPVRVMATKSSPENPVLPMERASVESLATQAGWNYHIDDAGDLTLAFAGEDGRPDQIVRLLIELSKSEEPWGVTFLHPVGVIPAMRAAGELENLLRSANEFNGTRRFGKIFLGPEEDGSWNVRFMHSFDFSDGISAANFLDPLFLMIQEMNGIHDRFFMTLPERSSGG